MAEPEKFAVSLEGVEKTIDSLSNLFLVIWDKSELLAYFVIVMATIFPFWVVYAWLVANKPERGLDRRIEDSRKASKKRLKGNAGGKKK